MLRWLNIGLVLLTLPAYLAPHVNPEHFWPVAVFGLLVPWLLLGNACLAVLWIIRKKWMLAGISGLVLLMGMDYWPRFGYNSDEAGQRMISLNCHGFVERGERIQPAEAADFLATLSPDFLCLQEYPFAAGQASSFAEAIQAATGLKHYYRHKGGGLAIFSRYPLQNGNGHFFANNANGYLYADADTPAGKLRIFNIHLQTNAISRMASQVAEEGDLQRRDTWLTIKGMLTRYGRSAKRRIPQINEIMNLVDKSPHPVVLCGDFNEVPASYTYRSLSTKLADAFIESGWGIGATYAGPLPGLRIDYIMHDRQWPASSFKTESVPFSDHRAVSTLLHIK